MVIVSLSDQARSYAEASGRSSVARTSIVENQRVSRNRVVDGHSKPNHAIESVQGGRAKQGAQRSEHLAQRGYPTVSAADTAVADPINNMGSNSGGECLEAVELVLTESGKAKIHMIQRPAHDQVCVIDWINFTVSEDTWFRTARQTMVANDEIIMEASRHLEKIFGFGITAKRDTGMNFYKESWILGDDFGFVCFGGQRATMLITLSGQGCVNATAGWQQRLHDFLSKTAIRPQISRIDLAHDDVEGRYLSLDWAEAQWTQGGYTAKAGGRAPSIECVGNWHRPTGAGRTLYIGLRTSGKFCRFYEKGKKEGDANSPWVRCEVEFKSSDRLIPLEILIRPSGYFAGAYPCFAEFAQYETLSRMEYKQQIAHVVVDAALKVTKHQFGKYLRAFRELYGDKETLDKVCNDTEQWWPRRLKPLGANAGTSPRPVHETGIPSVPGFLSFIMAVPSYGLNGDNCPIEAI